MDDIDSSMTFGPLQELSSDNCLPKLEVGVQAGLHILSEIKSAFGNANSVPELAQWIESSKKLQSQAASRRTVVGVVGSTGAGKSSVINATLDEECLVPTNCMRACTAVITEIAYNDSERDDEKYRAEVHFITSDAWTKELRVLRDDMDTSQASIESDQPSGDSSAAVAYDKIRSVYPFLKSDVVKKAKFDIHELVQHPSVKDLLGSVKRIASGTSEEFLGLLQRFIDSKEKGPGKKKDPDAMEYWPLIKVVKVFVRSPILKSGLVLVDLPGVQDSNAARSAVASKYIQECSGLWVVAPITRAADDRVAQDLLGDSFKRQLQFDGTYSTVTFICSKADDISVTEALKTIDEDHPAHQLHVETGVLEEERDKLQETISELRKRMAEVDDGIEQCLTEIDELKSGIAASDDEDDILDETPSASEAEPEKERISRDLASQRLSAAETRLTTLRAESKDLKKRCQPQQKALRELKHEIKSRKSETKHACIQFRNDSVRPAIQSQFAQGIREIDQDNAAHDEDNFDPNDLQRDYAEIARKLPVFCVSSKAYQKMSGRLESDERIAGFGRLEDTEIPALQRHALGIAGETRAVTCRQFLRDLGLFITSLHLQVVLSDQPLKLADDLREKECQALAKALDELRKELTKAVREAFIQCRAVANLNLFGKFESGAQLASNAAIPTVKSWICPRDDGGLAYQTFRATCVRDGVFKGAKGPMDFNKTLAEPMTKHFAKSWENVFSSALPEILAALAESLVKSLRSFRKKISKRQQLTKASSFALATRQVKILEKRLKDTSELKGILSAGQKDASRLSIPVVAEAMADVYAYCVGESGIGCFKRIKNYILEHVEGKRGTMFRAAARKMEDSLRGTIDELESTVDKDMENIIGQINQDYSALLKDENIFKELTSARDAVRSLLGGVDERFEQVLRGPAEPADSNQLQKASAMDVDHDAASATAHSRSSRGVSASSRATSVAPAAEPSTATAVHDTVRIKTEPLSTAAVHDDVPMNDV